MATTAPNASAAAQNARAKQVASIRGLKQLAEARSRMYDILSANERKTSFGHAGYRSREDVTTLPPGVMIPGSYNVLTNTSGRIGNRQGYTLDGQNNTAISPILSSYDWETHTGTNRNLRAGGIVTGTDGFLQTRYTASAGDYYNGTTYIANQVIWLPIMSNLSSVRFNFAPIYNTSYQQQYLLLVNGGLNYYEWSGGTGTILSSTFSTGVVTAANVGVGASGGSGYKVGDTLTVTGGGGTGLTVQVATLVSGQVGSVSVYNSGGKPTATKANPTPNGYAVNDILTLQGGGGNATVTVTSVNGTAGITGVSLLWGGFNYTAGQICAVSGGSGGINGYIQIGTVNNQAVAAISIITPGTGYSSTAGAATTGGTGTGATVNINTVVKGYIQLTGSTTAAQQNFYSYGGNITINGNLYNYSLAVNGYLTGLSADPTAEHAQSVVLQVPNTIPNTAATGLPINTFSNDLISVLNNQIYLGSLSNNSVYVSKDTNYTDFSFTAAGRLPGEGAVLTLDVNPIALQPQEQTMYISGGKDVWYEVTFTLSADLTKEDCDVQRLNTTANQGAQSQSLTSKMKNAVVFLSYEPIVNSFGRVDNVVLTPQMTDLSNPIINDMVQYNFTDGDLIYYQNYLYIAVPKNGVVLVYNMTDPKNPYWEAPQIIPVSRFAIINGSLFGHSYQSPVTYELFNGWSDNGHAMQATAAFSYEQLGMRALKKSFNQLYSEGYISSNTTLMTGVNYEYGGFGGTVTASILGTDFAQVEVTENDNSLGKFSLGTTPLGGDLTLQSAALPPKFRSINTFPRTNFFEFQRFFTSDGINFQWQITAFGSNITMATDLPVEVSN